MTSIYDSPLKDAPNSAIDFNEIKKIKLQLQKSNRELSAGGQNTTTVATAATKSRITDYNIYIQSVYNIIPWLSLEG